MPGRHTEQAFETAIEHHLTTAGGYEKGDRQAFDRERCVDAQVNPDFAPIVLRDVPEGEVSVLAELVEVLRPTAGN